MKITNGWLIIAAAFSITWAIFSSYVYWDGLSHRPYSYASHYDLHDYFEWHDENGNKSKIKWIIVDPPPKDVLNPYNQILQPKLSLGGFIKFVFSPIILGWLVIAAIYIAIWRRNWAIDMLNTTNIIAIIYILAATFILKVQLGFDFIESICVSIIPFLVWFLLKKIIYGLIYTAAKAIEDAKK